MKDTMRVTYNKLVRDKIPQIIEADGHSHKMTRLDASDYLTALKAKLVEESEEVRKADDAGGLKTELADVLEVIMSICDAISIPFSSVAETRQIRAEQRGRFEEKLFLHYVDEQQLGSPSSSDN